MEELKTDQLDEQTQAFYLELPAAKVVDLQAYFEAYESLGIVRTIDTKRSLVCVITTKSLQDHCIQALNSLRGQLQWRSVTRPQDISAEAFLGFGRKAKSS